MILLTGEKFSVKMIIPISVVMSWTSSELTWLGRRIPPWKMVLPYVSWTPVVR
jgi:hypothetical protein